MRSTVTHQGSSLSSSWFVSEIMAMAHSFLLAQLAHSGRLRVADMIAKNKTEEEEVEKNGDGDVCDPLPFPLQDLCLLVVMSNLDSYQGELLASLPLWLRRRLLNILPVLDLCRLEHTSVANGVDVEAIWKSRSKLDSLKPRLGSGDLEKNFQLNVSCYMTHNYFMKEEMKSVFSDVSECNFSPGEQVLLGTVSDIFKNSCLGTDCLGELIHRLISIEGDYVFSNLLCGSAHEPCPQCGQRVWKTQASAIAVDYSLKTSYLASDKKILLTPHHLQPLLKSCDDPLKLLSVLDSKCSLQPSNAYVDIDSIYNLLSSEMLFVESGSSLPSGKMNWISVVNHMLEKVSILGLKCKDYSNFGVMIRLVEMALRNSELKHLYCTMPELYKDTLQPFSTLFSLQDFCQLSLDIGKLCPLIFSKLLHEFMITPCLHKQKLKIHIRDDLLLPKSLEKNQLGVLYKGRSLPVPPCSPQHKLLQFSSPDLFTRALYLLLQFPTIRLKEMTLASLHEYHEYLHLCTLHPDLQVAKLKIDIPHSFYDQSIAPFLATVQEDLVSFLGMQTLEKIVITGIWGKLGEVKLGLVQGLRSRCRSRLPLKKITLGLMKSDNYKMRECQMLFEAIFSLPKLDSLKLVLGKGFVDMIRQKKYEELLYKSWVQRSSKVQLKSLSLQSFGKVKLKQLQNITQELSFTSPKFTHSGRSHALTEDDEDDDSYYGCYDYDDGFYYNSSGDEYGFFYDYY